uniref:Uncharacterized protein n=1 Tax=Octopus bimaculoides TaxID=37653 RepID=A0A0L8HXB1_OCTBM
MSVACYVVLMCILCLVNSFRVIRFSVNYWGISSLRNLSTEIRLSIMLLVLLFKSFQNLLS